MTVEFDISGPGGSYRRVFSERPPLNLWRTYGTTLDESQWTRVSGSWDALMDSVTDLRISIEFITGDETNGLDNVCLIESTTPTTIGLAKQMPDGTQVTVPGVVSRLFGDAMYIQSEDRSAGIRVKNSFTLSVGDRVTVVGNLATRPGERVLENATVLNSTPGEPPAPLGMVSPAEIGGLGATSADPDLGPSRTLKETGLLVRVFGTASDVDEPEASFTLNYGGAIVPVRCEAGALLPPADAWASIDGISASDALVSPSPIIINTGGVAAQLGINLIRNAGAEAGPGGTGGTVASIPDWTTTSNFTVCAYPAKVAQSESDRIGGGANFFYGGNNTSSSGASQIIDLSPIQALIDAGGISAAMSAYLAGYSTQGDSAKVVATFRDGAGASLGEFEVGPQTGSNQLWILHEAAAAVPVGTRSALVEMIATRTSGSNCDACFDELSLVLEAAP